MYETTEKSRRQLALLVSVDMPDSGYNAQESIDELEELTVSAGADVYGKLVQRRQELDAATCVGRGKLEEIRELAQAGGVDLVIFDHELTAIQQKNTEEAVGLPVVDRTTLILDIFAQRARSREGRLQVELAQLQYRLPRLAGQGTALSRLGGGIGTRGPGETKLESDRRHIRRRIHALEEELEELGRRRQLLRSRRKKDGFSSVAIVGYTNVGKSTLLNRLTAAGVLSEDRLFATLDSTARGLTLPDGRTVILVDTVGLVRRLPHQLVEAFKSTLEEAAAADLLLSLCDISSGEAEQQMKVTRQLLEELGAGEIPLITVLNKCDRVEPGSYAFPAGVTPGVNGIAVSAVTGEGLEQLLALIARTLPPTQLRMKLLIPYAQGGFLAKIRETGKIYNESYEKDGTLVDALVDLRLAGQAKDYQI